MEDYDSPNANPNKPIPLPESNSSITNPESSPGYHESAMDSLPPNADNVVVTQFVQEDEEGGTVLRALKQLWRTIVLLRHIPVTALFLVASAIFNDGISVCSLFIFIYFYYFLV